MKPGGNALCVVTSVDRISWVMVALVLAVPRLGSAQVVKATDAMRKIKTTTNLATVPTSGVAAISAPRNDFEAFQIVVQGPADNVSATASSLIGPGPALTPASCNTAGQIRLYREAIINITTATPGYNGGTGGYPDALIPNVDEFDQQCRTAFPFSVPSGENRVIWVEVYVPPDRASGTYTGQVTVSYTGGSTAIQVQLEVWDFTLPPVASLRSYFGLSWPEVQSQHPNAPCCGTALSTLRARYSALALDHRISTPHFDDGIGFASWTNYDTYMGPLINGTAQTRTSGARMTSMNMMDDATQANAAKWRDHFAANGWFSRLFEYAADEPGTSAPFSTPWNQIAPNCDNVHAANPDFRCLVVSTFARVNDPSTAEIPPSPAIPVGTLPPKVNILVPNVVQLEATSGNTRSQYDSWLASRPGINEVWQYISCSSYDCGGGSTLAWPTYVIDASMIQARALEWISFKNGLTGELYFDTAIAYAAQADPWTNQMFSAGNGDGTLFYPGTPQKVGPQGGSDIPIASLRMKMIREGMEDYELLNILTSQNDRAWALTQVNALFPSGSQVDQDPTALYNTRKQFACRILQNMGKPNPCNPSQPLLTVSPQGLGTGTVTSSPPGINCGTGGSACQFLFASGATVTLTASPDAGSTFSTYGGDCTGSTCSLTMNASKLVTATFTKPCTSSDCFDRPDSANLGPNWNTYVPALQITNGQATNTDPSTASKASQWLQSVGADQDVAVDCKVTASGSNCGLMARWSDASNQYYAYLDAGLGAVNLVRNQAGVKTTIGSAARAIATNTYYHLRLLVQGSALSVYFNNEGTPTISVTDTGLTAGNFGGLHAFAGGAQTVWYATFDIKGAGTTMFPVNVTKSGTGSGNVTSSPAGIDCGTICSASFVSGTSVTLTASPGSGSSASGFTGGCTSSTANCTFTVSAITNVDAAFAVNDFSMIVTPASATAAQGANASYTVSTQVTSGSAQTVAFSTSGLPAGATASFAPASVTAGASSTMSVSVAASTVPGTYAFSIVGTGTATTKSVAATLVVTAPNTIAFRGMSTYIRQSTSTMHIDLVVPAGVQANDVLIANVFAGDYTSTVLPVITAPAGWTLVRQVSHGNSALLQIYSRVATATDAGTTHSWTTNVWVGSASSLVAYSGVNTAAPVVDVSAAQDNPSAATTYSTPSVTTSAAGELLLATYAALTTNGPTSSWSAPAGMTQRVFVNNTEGTMNGRLSLSNDEKVQSAAGSSGSFSSTSTPGQAYALTALIAVRPSSAPPPISFRASSTYIRQSTSTMHIDLVVPASVQTNDVLVANVFAGDYTSTVLPTITAPAGWTLVRQVSHGNAALLQIYSRVASATDAGTTYSWTTNVWVGSASSLLAYSGASATAPVDVSAAQDNPSAATTYSTPSVATGAAGELLLATYAGFTTSGPTSSWSAPTGMTQRVFVNNTEGTANGRLSVSNDDKIQSTAGASGTFSSTATPSQSYALTAVVALKR